MKFLRLLSVHAAAIALCSCSYLNQTPPPADYVIENVNLVPMNTEAVLQNQAVAVKDGKIIAIVRQSKANQLQANRRIDGEGRYLMPGLADTHVHVRWFPQAQFNLFLANGITSAFNMRDGDGEGKFDHLQLRSDVASGAMVGPRYLITGPQLQAEEVPDVEAAKAQVANHVLKKYDFLKVHGDIAPLPYRALLEGAKRHDLKVTGHAQHMMPLSESLKLASVEHMEEFLYVAPDPWFAEAAKKDFLPAYRANVVKLKDAGYRARIAREVAKSGTFVKPSLIVYHMVGQWASVERLRAMADDPLMVYLPQGQKDYWFSLEKNPYQKADFPIKPEEVDANFEVMSLLLRDFRDAGVPFMLSTDTFGTLIPGFSAHQELQLMVKAGLSPYEALRSGTVSVAKYLGEDKVAGTVEVGKRADFILVDGNPLQDVANASHVKGVFTHGTWYGESELSRLRSDARKIIQPK